MKNKNRITNENFFDEYEYFDSFLAEYLHVSEKGVSEYIKKMKQAVIEVRDILPEWDSTIARLEKLQKRFTSLNNAQSCFDDFQGKDEDIVWIRIFLEKIDNEADPLSKYSKLKFTYKKRKKSLLQMIQDIFN